MENYISLNIKHLCDKNYLSQKEFGDLFDVKQATVNTYISGRSTPSIDLIQKICTHFDITIDDFIKLDLSKENKGISTTATKIATVSEPTTVYGDKDTIIQAQRETIEAQKILIETLRGQLGQAS